MRSILAAVVLFSSSLANRILRDLDDNELNVELETSANVESSVADEPLQTLASLPPGAGDAVDWHFMTDTFSWKGRRDNPLYDVVQGHACQGEGRYDHSYYSASLCYWHPDTEHIAAQSWGLSWRGGYGPRAFCGGIGLQSGVCAKCSVCHDNSRDRDAQVDATAHVEIIPLPECMKETAIEAECNHLFEANNADLLGEDARCRDLQGRYETAVLNYNTINDTITSSELSITQLVGAIANGFPQGAHCGEQTLQDIRQTAVRSCRQFGASNAYDNTLLLTMRPKCELPPTYVKMAPGFASCQQGIEITSRMECAQALSFLNLPVFPVPPGSSDLNPSGCRATGDMAPVCKVFMPNRNNETHRRCERCSGQLDTLQAAVAQSDVAQAESAQWQVDLATKQEDIARHRSILAQSYQQFSLAAQMRGALEVEWLPQQQHCHQVYNTVASARNSNMMACAPQYYDRSCEKACVEIQHSGEHGCGVAEGSQYGDAFERGGIEVTCSPPAPSWIMSPSNYGGSTHPNSEEQCGRINAEQHPRATTPVMMSGWLTRPGNGGWFSRDARRFYVLESGNGVRSATLRSFDGALPDGTEETNNGIIMWDAEEVSATETTREQACFEIKHRYDGRSTSWQRRGTTTTICATRGDSSGNMASLRDQWVSILQGLLIWQPRVA